MDKKKIRKCFTKAHKAAEPLTDNLSHKDIKHVKDSMQAINAALKKLGGYPLIHEFDAKHHYSLDGDKYYQVVNGHKSEITPKGMVNVIKVAKQFVKKHF